MTEAQHLREQRQAFDAYVRQAAASGTSSADELAKLSELRPKGVLSDAEFERAKEKALSS